MVSTFLSSLPFILPAIVGAFGGRFVREGERAILMRFDRAVVKNGAHKVVYPGFKWMVPIMNKLARISVQLRTINLPAQSITLADGTVFTVSAVMFCHVRDTTEDLYNALFKTPDLEKALIDRGLVAVQKVLKAKHWQKLVGDGQEDEPSLTVELLSLIRAPADECGVEVLSFELSDCSPSPETERLLQTPLQAQFRRQALYAVAQQEGCGVTRLDPILVAATLGGTLVPLTGLPVGFGLNGNGSANGNSNSHASFNGSHQ